MIIKKIPCQHEWEEVVPGVFKCKKCGDVKKTGEGSAKMNRESGQREKRTK